MSPEERFRRLKDDDVWSSDADSAEPAGGPSSAGAPRRGRGPMWVTAVVAASLVVITVAAVHGARPASDGVGAVGAPVAETAPPTATGSPTPTDTRSVDPSDPALRSVEFFPNDPADMARARTIIACFKSHGVKIVGLVPSDDPKIDNIGYGGPQNDHASIMKGLKYQDECFKAGGPAE